MILYYFPISQNIVNKTVKDFFRDVYACICMCTYFSIYWSDTSLGMKLNNEYGLV